MRCSQFVQALLITGVLALSACGGSEETATTPDTSAAESSVQTETAAAPTSSSSGHSAASEQGGQVVESGPYHLELVPEPEANGIHLDFFLQKGDTHEPIADAKVMAQVQSPDGTQESLEMTYDSDGKHYTAMLPATASGNYSVAILSDIGGEKVNGRFTFAK